MSSTGNGEYGGAIIDCLSMGRAFDIVGDSIISFYNVTMVNCVNSIGAAISVRQSIVYMDYVKISNSKSDMGTIYLNHSSLYMSTSVLTNNVALNSGASLYLASSTAEITNSTLAGNTRVVMIPNPRFEENLLVSAGSRVQVIGKPPISVFCSADSTVVDAKGASLCTNVLTDSPLLPTMPKCGDHTCELFVEDFFSCPDDCNSTRFTGMLQQDYHCTSDKYKTAPSSRAASNVQTSPSACWRTLMAH
ncbi:hypothetical protein SAMD00019534_119080 [Acytostelium subglobosum LB1]|uniref:hypothetical protein n=1 Tax=Acytostelium subglobosum LB1 TaxID=1410327 RepID=UPI00064492F7|nr:hypothetical protein SAMD00019534_119080 [Acytostelium subglobosum LB1]GAM28732.1 hypothetical protein SAMD00019534_119080 [Acytostelium subglobosum LB1]|eukprot:XP_012748287.1 hypothetical protein SAMD00019534_119080 [Acytostelium subglobosum LB1]